MLLALTTWAALAVAPAAGSVPSGLAGWARMSDEPGLLEVLDPDRAWGTPSLVEAIRHAALDVALRFPDADPLLVGDLSTLGGGPLDGHKTHDLGQDADVGLYLGAGGMPRGGFVDVTPDRLDLAKTWALVNSLLDQPEVRYLLLDQAHIDALRAYLADVRGFPRATLDALFPGPDAPWTLHGVVRHAPDHMSHLHVHAGIDPES